MNDTLTAAAIQLEQQAESLPALSSGMAKQAALAIIQDLGLTTPVDTGTAVSNWQVTIDAPAGDVIAAFAPSPKGTNVGGKWEHTVDPSITRQANAGQMIANGAAVIAAKPPEHDLYITNNLDYISILNQGSSEQAPAGFTERAQAISQSVLDSSPNLG